jgi:hypothetical protein
MGMIARPLSFVLVLAAVAALLPASQARADAIDGDWCLADGRHFSIRGPEIVTPGGNRMEGDYDRHAFSYTVPEDEPGAGAIVFMTLVDEDTIHLRQGARSTDPAQIWRRCTLHTS